MRAKMASYVKATMGTYPGHYDMCTQPPILPNPTHPTLLSLSLVAAIFSSYIIMVLVINSL